MAMIISIIALVLCIIGALVCVFMVAKLGADPSITNSGTTGISLPKIIIEGRRKERTKVPRRLAYFFGIAGIAIGVYIMVAHTEKVQTWWTDIRSHSEEEADIAELVSGNSLEGSESAEEDETENAEANTTEPVETETTAADEETSAATVASSATTVTEKVGKTVTEMAASLQQEKTADAGPVSTEEFVQKWMNFTNEEGLARFTALLTTDDTVYAVNEIIRINPDWANIEFGQYRMDTKLHSDWEEQDWLHEYMGTFSYDGEVAIDLLMFPAWSDWEWLEQASGTRKVTAEDLLNVDLSDHEALKKLIKDKKVPQWQGAWKALSDEEKANRIDELVYISIINCPGAAEAWYLGFCEAPGVYEACKDILDDIGRRFDEAYDLTRTITVKDKNGVVREVTPEDKDYPKGRERWLTYPENVDFFNPERPEFSATYSDEYFEAIAAQLCHIYSSLKTGKIQALKTDKHWCLPRLLHSNMRRAAAANYTDSLPALIKTMPGKNGEMAYKFGVNISDMRPELFSITVYERIIEKPKPQEPVNPWLHIRYQYEDGTKAAEPHDSQHAAGEGYRVVSPVISGYLCDKPVVEGTMPGHDVYEVVTYKKLGPPPVIKDDPDPTPTPPTPTPTPTPPPTPPTPEDKKDDTKDPVNQNNAETGGGEQEPGLDERQDIEEEEDNAENHPTPPPTTPTPPPTPPTPPQSDSDASDDTTHEGDSDSSSNGGQSGTITTETTTDNGDGTTTTTETTTDTDSERNEASEENFSGF